jgi:hypothetical protein
MKRGEEGGGERLRVRRTKEGRTRRAWEEQGTGKRRGMNRQGLGKAKAQTRELQGTGKAQARE